jgi:hypothetical protein
MTAVLPIANAIEAANAATLMPLCFFMEKLSLTFEFNCTKLNRLFYDEAA